MRKVNVVKRGKIFQYKFEIAPQDEKRKFKNKSGFKTSASAFDAGADIKAVSKRLGHSKIQTTYNIYVRVTEKMGTDTGDRFKKYSNSLDIPNIKEQNSID